MTWTTPVDPTAGQTVTASYLKTYVTDDLKDLAANWTAYTTTWGSSGTQPAIGNGTISAAASQQNKRISFRITVTAGSTTTFGTGNYTLILPATPVAGTRWRFAGWYFDTSGGALYDILGHANGGTTINLYVPASPVNTVTPTVPVTMANGDSIHLQGRYEAA